MKRGSDSSELTSGPLVQVVGEPRSGESTAGACGADRAPLGRRKPKATSERCPFCGREYDHPLELGQHVWETHDPASGLPNRYS